MNTGSVRRLLVALAGALAFAMPVAGQTPVTAAPVTPKIETPAEAITQDATEYSKQFGVPVAEAEQRLRALDESVAVTGRLGETYRDRLAGISIEHRPALRIVAYLTGDTPVPTEHVTAGGIDVPIVFRTGAKATRDRVIWAMTYHQGDIRKLLPTPPAMGFDPTTGELIVIVTRTLAPADVATLQPRIAALTGVPVRLRVLDRTDVNLAVRDHPRPSVASLLPPSPNGRKGPAGEAGGEGEVGQPPINGGSRVEGVDPADGKRYVCTSAFNVTDGTRYATTTAAHCVDDLAYRDPRTRALIPLHYEGQWGWGYQDVQVNSVGGALAPLFYSDTAKTGVRPVTGQRTRGRPVRRAVPAQLGDRRGAELQGRRQRQSGVRRHYRARRAQGRQLSAGRIVRLLFLHVGRLPAPRLDAGDRAARARHSSGCALT
jgi:streptogrisin C